jgi:hypothetical protein
MSSMPAFPCPLSMHAFKSTAYEKSYQEEEIHKSRSLPQNLLSTNEAEAKAK